jgi:hypothetical protein
VEVMKAYFEMKKWPYVVNKRMNTQLGIFAKQRNNLFA